MFGISRIFKRNRLCTLKFLTLIASCCLIYLLIKTTTYSSQVKDLDYMSPILNIGKDHDIKEPEENSVLKWSTDTVRIPNVDHFPETRAETIAGTIPQRHEPPDNSEKAFPVIHNEDVKTFSKSSLEHTHTDLEKMAARVKQLNQEQKILNLKKFPKRSSNSVVIVVQVHKRNTYLNELIQSLRNVRGISDALLIFSHDYFSSSINNLVRKIDFCQVLQIFFPYSAQLHPHNFPGTDPNDCPRDTSRHKALAMGCNNAKYPDMYGHYREAKFTMTKHHWWWKANRVFRDIRHTKNHKGLVLFLEEDHYVTPDFYEVLQKAYSKKKSSKECQEHGCEIVTLGDYRQISHSQYSDTDIVEIQPWKSTEHNMGMAFDRKMWNKIAQCGSQFCSYDDYNWDWTLMKMSSSCFDKPLTVLLFKFPRVFHLGTCGLHHRTGNCNVETVVSGVKNAIESSARSLHPKQLVVRIASPWLQGHPGRPNGGWGDKRDHKLCMQFTQSTE